MKLFKQVQLGSQTLRNKMVMAAMTRSRADENGVVGDLTVLYYTQRASAGMILTEGINIRRSPMFPLLPGYPEDDEIELLEKLVEHPLYRQRRLRP